MKNPNNKQRNIRHAKVMLQAGFRLSEKWMKHNENHPLPPDCGVAKLIYWEHPSFDCLITLFDNQQISLKKLIKRTYEQAVYHTKHKATIVFH